MVVQDRINNSDPDMTFINPNPRGPFWSLTSRGFIAIFGS